MEEGRGRSGGDPRPASLPSNRRDFVRRMASPPSLIVHPGSTTVRAADSAAQEDESGANRPQVNRDTQNTIYMPESNLNQASQEGSVTIDASSFHMLHIKKSNTEVFDR